MEGIVEVLKWPLASLEGVAFLEMLLIFGVIILWRDIRNMRAEAKKGREKLWDAVNDHVATCGLYHTEDQRWKGDIGARVKAIERAVDRRQSEGENG